MNALRIIEQSLQATIAPELAQHEADLEDEGWEVETIFTPAVEKKPPYSKHIALAQNIIWPRLNPGLHIILIGKVPIPSTGIFFQLNEISSDQGCMPTAAYYILPNIPWSDILSNATLGLPSTRTNTPGDGWFDQERYGPAIPTSCVGVIQFKDNPNAWKRPDSNVEFLISLYKEYFKRMHDYRLGKWRIKTPAGQFSYYNTIINPSNYFRAWAEKNYGESGYIQFGGNSSNDAIYDSAPYGVAWDFKRLPSTPVGWMTFPKQWAFLDLSFGSGQCAPDSKRIHSPFVWGSLASASRFGNWDLGMLSSGHTLGESWLSTINATGAGLAIMLHGDPTLRLLQ